VTPLDAILPYALVPDVPGVFVCGCFERWVSIYLQGVRALNLAWALGETGRVQPGARVCVVGGGFAGLTVAAGLSRRGARVTLLEQNAALLATQRNNHVRSIHPHIHEWPRPGARDRAAGLPLLDWQAGKSAEMAADVLRGFDAEAARSGLTVHTGARPIRVAAGPSVAWGDAPPVAFAAVVLALGVGIEKSFGSLPLRSYWADETIARIRTGGVRHHLVTGIGEGGVIDALYLRLGGFSHAQIAGELAAIPDMRAVETQLLEIETEIEGRPDDEANRVLHERYAALPVPPAVDALLRARLRADTRVTLNGPEPHPLASRADILNRFLISRLVAIGGLDYLPGKIAGIEPDGERFRVDLDGGGPHRFDDVNIRHGTVPALKQGFPEIWARYHPARVGLPHLIPEPLWPDGAFDL
jgi:hypothetical protein